MRYRRTLTLLWAGAILFGAAAALDAFIDYMKNAQGILIGLMAMFFVGALEHVWLHRLNQTATLNRHVAENLKADINRLSNQLGHINGQVGEVQNTVTLIAVDTIEKESREAERRKAEAEIEARRQAAQPLATVHQIRLRDGNRDAIVGGRTPTPIDANEVWKTLNAHDTGTRGAS